METSRGLIWQVRLLDINMWPFVLNCHYAEIHFKILQISSDLVDVLKCVVFFLQILQISSDLVDVLKGVLFFLQILQISSDLVDVLKCVLLFLQGQLSIPFDDTNSIEYVLRCKDRASEQDVSFYLILSLYSLTTGFF